MSAVYIYGIVKEPRARVLDYRGIGEAEVYMINAGGLSAVASRVETSEVDPTRRNVCAHVVVQDNLMKEYTLLPMSFGTVADDDESIAAMLEKNHDIFAAELARFAGRIEASLKVFWESDAIIAELREKDKGFDKLKEEAGKAPREKAELLLVEIGKKVEKVALEWQQKYGSRIYAPLKALAIDAVPNEMTAPRCILAVSFLLEKAREDEFKARIYALDEQYDGKLQFKYVAPLPPYSFVTVRLEGGSKAKRDSRQVPL